MAKYSYRFSGTSFTGQKYRYTGPSSDPCRKVSNPSDTEMISNTGWELSGEDSFIYGNSRGIFFGANTNSYPIQFINISSSGTSHSFGSLLSNHYYGCACSSSTKGIYIGGEGQSSIPNTSMEYITISTISNSSSYGDITTGHGSPYGCSNATYGIFGTTGDGVSNKTLHYITLSTNSNSTYFGDLISHVFPGWGTGGCASPTIGIFFALYDRTDVTQIYGINSITMGTGGETSYFGDMSPTNWNTTSACSSNTKGICASGTLNNTLCDYIKYIFINSAGSLNNFSTLSESKTRMMSSSSLIRGVFAGGDNNETGYYTKIEYIVFLTYAEASNFGDLIESKPLGAGCSNCHGGLA